MSRQNDQTEVIPTKDGSTTLYSEAFSQHYHNPNGAVAESRHVFFDTAKVAEILHRRSTVTIFETGFGSGLNLVLLMDLLKETETPPTIHFYSVEAHPIGEQTAQHLDFGESSLNTHIQLLANISKTLKPGMNHLDISPSIQLHLYHGLFDDLFEKEQIPHRADFIFHDPFSPEVNAELWTADVFRKLAFISHPETVLITYCAATSARAAMAVAGWYVARARGALGKREMTIASRNPEKLSSFKRVNEKRLVERYERGDFHE